MRLLSSKRSRSASALYRAALVAACFLLQISSSFAQTLPSETNGNPNEVLVFEQMRVPRWLAETVVRAAQVTGVDPAYMMALADKESSLLPDNKARTSSAEGLFQFVEGTWLEVLRRYGPKHGYAAEAEAIQIVKGGPRLSDGKRARADPALAPRSVPLGPDGRRDDQHPSGDPGGQGGARSVLCRALHGPLSGVNGASRFVALLSDTARQERARGVPQRRQGQPHPVLC